MSRQGGRKLRGKEGLCLQVQRVVIEGHECSKPRRGFLCLNAKLPCPFISVKLQRPSLVTIPSNKEALSCLRGRKWLSIYAIGLLTLLQITVTKYLYLHKEMKPKCPYSPSSQLYWEDWVSLKPTSMNHLLPEKQRRMYFIMLYYLSIKSFFKLLTFPLNWKQDKWYSLINLFSCPISAIEIVKNK